MLLNSKTVIWDKICHYKKCWGRVPHIPSVNDLDFIIPGGNYFSQVRTLPTDSTYNNTS